tara:strand:- start:263 stop:847 length:585 start_codon:yes stop_codon:yes gene_type:complete
MKAFSSSRNIEKFRPALFLDRDGVINLNHGYVHKIENFNFLPEIFDLLSLANERGYLVIVITNQAGIGRGLYSDEQFNKLTIWMVERFKERNITIDGVFYSPFHPIHGIGKYLLKENTRKPGSGMFEEAFKYFQIIKSNSIMIGDNITDLEASNKAGIKNNLLLDSNKINSNKSYSLDNFDIISSLSEAKDFIK